jgi:hypothetical protein
VTVETNLDAATTRVAEERSAVATKRRAYEALLERVRDVSTDGPGPSASGRAAAGWGPETPGAVGPTLATSAGHGDGCGTIREAFAETVGGTDGVEDGSIREALAGELSQEVAVALAPATGSTLTPGIKAQVVEAVTDRRWQLRAMETACERERDSLESAAETVDAIRTDLAAVSQTTLRVLGFEELRTRHARLGDAVDRCESLARERQAFLEGSTAEGAQAGLTHRRLVSFLYAGLPVDYPVLAAVATATAACERRRRNVRAHLTRCV